MHRTFLIAAPIIFSIALTASALDGKSAAVVTLSSTNTSRIIVCTVSNSVVTRVDTILRANTGSTFSYPTFSFDGTRIAFYKSGAGVAIVDAAGSNLRTVAQTPNRSIEDHLAWPGADGGKWLYYHKPNQRGEIWKVNVLDTAQKSLVVDYIRSVSTGSMQNWALSADAQYCAMRGLGPWGADSIGFTGGIWPHTFPPRIDPNRGWTNPELTAPDVCCNLGSECNVGISASGKILCHFSGQHSTIYGVTWDHTAKTTAANNPRALFTLYDIENWIKPSPVMPNPGVGDSFLRPRGSSNSDKVFVAVVNWAYAEYSSDGSNLAVVNWKDREATMVTSNPDQRTLQTRWIADPGDFWSSGGPAGCYQDLSGNAVNVATGQVVGTWEGTATQPSQHASVSRLSAHPDQLTAYDLRGVRIARALSLGSTGGARHGLLVTADHGKAGKLMMVGAGGVAR